MYTHHIEKREGKEKREHLHCSDNDFTHRKQPAVILVKVSVKLNKISILGRIDTRIIVYCCRMPVFVCLFQETM